MAKTLSRLICLIVIIVGFVISGQEGGVDRAIYIAIGCMGLVGMAIVISLPKAPEAPKPATPTESTSSAANV